MRDNGKGCIPMLVTDLSRFQGKQTAPKDFTGC